VPLQRFRHGITLIFSFVIIIIIRCGAVDSYNYLINGDALSTVQEFIANPESAYEDYIEVKV